MSVLFFLSVNWWVFADWKKHQDQV